VVRAIVVEVEGGIGATGGFVEGCPEEVILRLLRKSIKGKAGGKEKGNVFLSDRKACIKA
jgi:hypothetical protein